MTTALEQLQSIIEAAGKLQELLPGYVRENGDAGAELDELDACDDKLWFIVEYIEEHPLKHVPEMPSRFAKA